MRFVQNETIYTYYQTVGSYPPESPVHSKAQCPICERVSLVITGRYEPPPSAESKELTVGTFAEIRRSQDCTVCQFVIEKLSEDPVSDAYEDGCPVAIWRWAPPDDYLYSFGPIESETDYPACGLAHHFLTLVDLELADLNPEWIDLNWPNGVDENSSSVSSTIAPRGRYLQVSSRNPHRPCTGYSVCCSKLRVGSTRANEQDLRQKHALTSPSYVIRLPDTVRDAIELVYRLNIPYLWANRLCVVRDEFDKKLPQLEQIGAIYANAYLTLVAADGHDANYGLRGSCPGVTRPRVLGSPLLTFSPAEKTLAVEPDFAPQIGPREWYRRGWTFQERTLSNRNLIFQQGHIFWECRGAVWTGELAYAPPSEIAPSDDGRVIEERAGVLHQRILWNQREKPSHYSITFSQWPILLGYEILVRTYNELLLSFPGDGLRAFTGIINTLSQSFPGGMLYGMPEYFFDYAITWAPWTPIHRRVVGRLDLALPSWSSAGWVGGDINLSIAPFMHQRVDAARSIISWDNVEIYPNVNWQKVDIDTGTNQSINNSYYEALK
ncbi:hypothetical protein GGR58DRAFT_526776 [Xylaria digitata]|nr:hypothetical protein GGR58DRAFT_526776 [Xylaria digitata]